MSDVRYSVTTATTDNLRKCYGCVKEVPRIVTDHCGYVTNSLRFCYGIAGSDGVKPRSHYGVDGMLRLCNCSAAVSTEREALDRLCVRLNMYLVIIIIIIITF